jgi:hypothetical protein
MLAAPALRYPRAAWCLFAGYAGPRRGAIIRWKPGRVWYYKM